MVQEVVPTAKLTGMMMSDPTGDWIHIEESSDLECMYRVARLAEQKIIKIQAEFEPVRNVMPIKDQ